ncbi:hypothetical protein ACVWZA_001331 [Sphingomonas sp. UYAg733]
MRPKILILLGLLLSGCIAHLSSDVLADLAVNRQWVTNADGYVFTVGYFSAEQALSPAWENRRWESRKTASICQQERIVARDVRWFGPIAPGEPRCAAIIYSVSCPHPGPARRNALEYGRRQALLEDPIWPPTPGCGEKSRAKLLVPLTPVPAPLGADISEQANCRSLPDIQSGKFNLRDVNYVHTRALVSPAFLETFRVPFDGKAAAFVVTAATFEGKVHMVVVKRTLPDDGNNMFIEQAFASDSQGVCITLTARQGDANWRKTVRGDFQPQPEPTKSRIVVPLNQDALARMLQLDLADHLGIETSKLRRPPSSKGVFVIS